MVRKIGILVYADFLLLDASGPISAFEIANREVPGAYRLTIISMDGGSTKSSAGVTIETEPAASCARLDTLLVVGGEGSLKASESASSHAYLREAAAGMRRLCSVCSGAFLLASAGLLDGKRATTHWHRADDLQSRFPAVRVEADRIYIQDGAVWTSAGVSAGIDLSLALIAEDLGEAVARTVAKEMVVYYRRPGGQSQFSSMADLGGDATAFSPLIEWMRSHLEERLTVDQLALRMAMSPRNFSRRFVQAIGTSPAKAVSRLRLEAARERVEASQEPIEAIAAMTGFKDPERMRRAFVRAFGEAPQSVRRACRRPVDPSPEDRRRAR